MFFSFSFWGVTSLLRITIAQSHPFFVALLHFVLWLEMGGGDEGASDYLLKVFFCVAKERHCLYFFFLLPFHPYGLGRKSQILCMILCFYKSVVLFIFICLRGVGGCMAGLLVVGYKGLWMERRRRERGEAYGVLYSAMLGVVDRRDGYGVLAVWGRE